MGGARGEVPVVIASPRASRTEARGAAISRCTCNTSEGRGRRAPALPPRALAQRHRAAGGEVARLAPADLHVADGARVPELATSVVLPKFRYLQANNAGPEFLAGQPGETILSEVR